MIFIMGNSNMLIFYIKKNSKYSNKINLKVFKQINLEIID